VRNIKETLTTAMTLPKEIALDMPLLSITGRGELAIENYKSLLEFTDIRIRIRTKVGAVVVEGERLNLSQMTTENLVITGRIFCVKFEED